MLEIANKRLVGDYSYVGSERGNIDVFEPDVTAKIKAILEKVDDTKDHLQGNAANLGYAKGVARLILRKTDFGKLNKGEILVTTMTRPEFLP